MKSLRETAKHAVRTVVDWSPLRSHVVFRRYDSQRAIALTFDDGPDPVQTPALLDLLAEHRARATFFLVGSRARGQASLIRRIAAEGHAIGNHSFSHVDCSTLTDAQLHDEMTMTDRIIEESGVRPTAFFRPPWGRLTLRQMWKQIREGRQLIYWSLKSDDHILDPAAIVSKCLPARNREILLFHDGNDKTRAALPRLLKAYAEANFATLPLAEPQLASGSNAATELSSS